MLDLLGIFLFYLLWLQGRSSAADPVQVIREPCPAAQHHLLRAEGDGGYAPHCGGQCRIRDRAGLPTCARPMERGPGRGMEARGGRGACQGSCLLLPNMAHGARLTNRCVPNSYAANIYLRIIEFFVNTLRF
jgi:hypothetical protein